MTKKGFTLIELLVVIAVIATITAIAVVGLNRARDQSISSKTLNDLRAIEKAMGSLMIENEESIWWDDNSFGSEDPSIDNVTGLTQFLPKIPTPELPGVSNYLYDNDGDTLTAGSQSMNGVNIVMNASSTVVSKYFPLMDTNGDYGSGASDGKLRTNAGGDAIFFNLNPDQSDW